MTRFQGIVSPVRDVQGGYPLENLISPIKPGSIEDIKIRRLFMVEPIPISMYGHSKVLNNWSVFLFHYQRF